MQIFDFQAEYTDITATDSTTEVFRRELNALLEILYASQANEPGKYQLVRDFCKDHSMDETLLWPYLFAFDGKGATAWRLKEAQNNDPPSPFKAASTELKEKLLDTLSLAPAPLIKYYFVGLLKLRHVFMDRINFIFDRVFHDYLTKLLANRNCDAMHKFSRNYFEILMDELGEELNILYDMVYTPPLELIYKEYQAKGMADFSIKAEL